MLSMVREVRLLASDCKKHNTGDHIDDLGTTVANKEPIMTNTSVIPEDGAETQVSTLVDAIRRVFGWIVVLATLGSTGLVAKPATHADFREKQQATSVIGIEAKDSQDRTLGRVSELALDLENGRIVEMIVSSGGLLGFRERNVGVPPGALRFDAAERVLRLGVAKEKFKAAPSFAMSKWAEHCQSQHLSEDYRYFGQEPYFAADGQPSKSGNTATEPLGYVQRSGKLIHLPVKNLQSELLGKVDTLLYDLRKGRVLHVIVLASEDRPAKSVIPARALRFNPSHDALYLDVSLQAFRNQPRFQWTDGDDGGLGDDPHEDFEQETYSNTKVAANGGVNMRQNVKDGTANAYTPLAQKLSFADIKVNQQIYAAMRADTSLSQNAHDTEVGTLNGQITLRGHVNTQNGKRVIGEIAAKVGRPENVSNLLEVRALPGTGTQAN